MSNNSGFNSQLYMKDKQPRNPFVPVEEETEDYHRWRCRLQSKWSQSQVPDWEEIRDCRVMYAEGKSIEEIRKATDFSREYTRKVLRYDIHELVVPSLMEKIKKRRKEEKTSSNDEAILSPWKRVQTYRYCGLKVKSIALLMRVSERTVYRYMEKINP